MGEFPQKLTFRRDGLLCYFFRTLLRTTGTELLMNFMQELFVNSIINLSSQKLLGTTTVEFKSLMILVVFQRWGFFTSHVLLFSHMSLTASEKLLAVKSVVCITLWKKVSCARLWLAILVSRYDEYYLFCITFFICLFQIVQLKFLVLVVAS